MSRPRIVVLGMMTRMPVGGVVWQTAHYLLGLERIGYEVTYVEAHGINPSMFGNHVGDPGTRSAADFLGRTLDRFGLGDRWAFHALHDDGTVHGPAAGRLPELYRSAALILNLHGGTLPRDEHTASGRLVYVETDPVQVQVELHEGRRETVEFLDAHVAHFTFGERYGRPGCGLPVSERYTFLPTRQPVVLDLWPHTAPPGEAFTTIGNWRQSWRDLELDGERYTWSKHHEFHRVRDLPARVDRPLELALARCSDAAHSRLVEQGWVVRPAMPWSTDADLYRRYIAASRGEFTVAKDQNVRLRTGWFSDRSATYLAAGRPVVTQDTGFGHALPTGEGLLAWSSVDEATEALASIERDWPRHSAAARDVAREHFDAERVLKRLLAEVGV